MKKDDITRLFTHKVFKEGIPAVLTSLKKGRKSKNLVSSIRKEFVSSG